MAQPSDISLMDRLERDIARLLAKNTALRDENARLGEQNRRLSQAALDLKAELREREATVDRLLLSGAVTEVSGGTRAAKLRINRLLKEVDRCLALMNK